MPRARSGVYDRAYFDKWYRDPRHRVRSPAELTRLVTFVLATADYVQYLMSDGYASTYKELIETTDWSKYGRGNDPRCANCMAHCGYEPTAVIATMGSLKESLRAAVSV